MKKERVDKKIIVVIIAVLFFSISLLPNISGNIKDINDIKGQDSKTSEPDKHDVTFYSLGLGKSYTTEIQMTNEQVELLFDKIKQYTIISSDNTQTYKAQRLKEEIIQIAQVEDIIPKSMKDKLILENNVDPIFGFKKSTIFSPPDTQTKASAVLCNFATTGMGTQFPVLIFPRLVPVLLLPIPRVFFRWNAVEAVTSCGSYLTGTGYIAYGSQTGNALGFWGIGFSLFLPPIMNYAFIGYAVYSSVEAEIIEPWPPNYAPEVSAVYPPHEGFNIPISTSELKFSITDQNNDLMDFIVTTDPDIGSGKGEQVADGTYSIPISGLEGTEDYTWTVSVSDGVKSSVETFTFSTEPTAPVITDPVPYDDEKYVSISLSELSFKISDLQGDLMDYTVETSPDIGSGSGTGVSGGTYSVDIIGLDYSSEYLWFVNVTDGQNWKHKVFSFQTEHELIFDPFSKGWQYRKKITIDSSLVDGDLVNFPVLISTVDVDLQVKAQDDGDDILFMDGVGVADRLFHEIEDYDSGSGGLVAWVNIPYLDSSVDTEFYMYYGNPSIGDQQASELVWDENYVSVLHMSDKPDNAHILDSTFYENHGTKKYNNEPLEVEGIIGKAQNFDGSNDYIDTQDFDISDDFTITLWINPSSTEYGQSFIGKHTSGIDENLILCGYWEKQDGTKGYSFNIRESAHREGVIDLDWHKMVYVGKKTDPSSTDITVYKNGDILWQYTLNKVIGDVTGDYAWTIGQDWDSIRTDFYHGIIDEIRISNSIKNFEWIKTEFNNQNDPSSFYYIGPEET